MLASFVSFIGAHIVGVWAIAGGCAAGALAYAAKECLEIVRFYLPVWRSAR